MLAVIGSTVAAFWFEDSSRRNARLADEKEQSLQKAELASAEAQRRGEGERWERYRANIASAASALQLQNVIAATNALASAPIEHRNWEWRHFHSQLDTSRLVFEAPAALNTVVLSPDGRYVAAGSFKTPDVFVWDLTMGKQIHALSGGEGAAVSTLSPDCSLAAFGNNDGHLRLVDLKTGKETLEFNAHSGKVLALAFSSDSKHLATSGANRMVRLWDLAKAKSIASLPDLEQPAEDLILSPDGNRLIIVAGKIRLWDLQRQEPIVTLNSMSHLPIVFTPDSKTVWVTHGYPDNSAHGWDAVTGKPLFNLSGHQNSIFSFACSSDGSRLATASYDQTTRLWDAKSGNLIAVLRGQTGWILSVAFSPDGKRVVSTGQEGALRIWDARDGELIDVLRGHTQAVNKVIWSSDGRQLVSVSNDRTLRVWDLPSAAGRGVLSGHQNFVYDVACSPDGSQIASAAWDGTVRLWDVATGKETAKFKHENDVLTSVAFSPEGKQIASVARDDRIILWDLPSGKPRHAFKVITTRWPDVRAAFDPKGQRIAAGTFDGFVRLWDTRTGEAAGEFGAGAGPLYDVAFSPDGETIACAGKDGTIPIWHIERQEPRSSSARPHRGCHPRRV